MTPTQPDILTCGVCQKPFALGDIIKFIQHKMAACNKENYLAPFGDGDAVRHHDGSDSDDQNGVERAGDGLPLGVVNARRPSISAPINSKKVRPQRQGPRRPPRRPPCRDAPAIRRRGMRKTRNTFCFRLWRVNI